MGAGPSYIIRGEEKFVEENILGLHVNRKEHGYKHRGGESHLDIHTQSLVRVNFICGE